MPVALGRGRAAGRRAGGRGGVAPEVRWERVDVLRTGTMPLTIIRDTGEGPAAVKPDQVDVLETRSTSGAFDAASPRTTEILRQGRSAWIDVWDVR